MLTDNTHVVTSDVIINADAAEKADDAGGETCFRILGW